MSAENEIADSSSSGSEMEQDTPHKHKSGFKGEGDDIMPVRYLFILKYHMVNVHQHNVGIYLYFVEIVTLNCSKVSVYSSSISIYL